MFPQPDLSAASASTLPLVLKEREPVFDRVLLRRRRQLIYEAFGHEDVVRRTDTAPERGQNPRWLNQHVFDVQVREVVDKVDRAFSCVGVETVVERGRQPPC